jgi:molybdate transport system substrate-binding protein
MRHIFLCIVLEITYTKYQQEIGNMKKCTAVLIGAILIFFIIPLSVSAQEKIRVAVAANYIQSFKELAAVFEKKTGVRIEPTFSSSGNLLNQIKSGAPYDVFLSADEDRPRRLYESGEADKPFVYARGRVILWSARPDFCKAKDWKEALKRGKVNKIAIANPEIAPYGMAAKGALVATGLWESLKSKIVNSQDIAQAFQYASTEAVDAGFCALSASVSVQGKKGCFYEISDAPDIIQSACIIKKTKNRRTTEQFSQFLISSEADIIKKKYGYR